MIAPFRRMALAAAVTAAVVTPASAQEFPTKAITMVVPFAAGTTTDTVTRKLAEVMSDELGEPVVVENRAGAGGSVGTEEVVQAEPDGYTLAMGTVGTLAINKSVFPNLPYDPESDVTPIAFAGYTPTLLVVDADSDYETLDDLIEASKSGEPLTFASSGNGTSTHLAGELLKIESGGDMIHVPFGSGAAGLTAVLSGEVDFMFYHPVSAKPNIDAGKLRALGVSDEKGSSVMPDVTPIADTYEGFNLIAWFLVMGPEGLPEDVARTLNEAVETGLRSDAMQQLFERSGIQLTDIPYAELDSFISSEVKKWGDIAEAADAQVD